MRGRLLDKSEACRIEGRAVGNTPVVESTDDRLGICAPHVTDEPSAPKAFPEFGEIATRRHHNHFIPVRRLDHAQSLQRHQQLSPRRVIDQCHLPDIDDCVVQESTHRQAVDRSEHAPILVWAVSRHTSGRAVGLRATSASNDSCTRARVWRTAFCTSGRSIAHSAVCFTGLNAQRCDRARSIVHIDTQHSRGLLDVRRAGHKGDEPDPGGPKTGRYFDIDRAIISDAAASGAEQDRTTVAVPIIPHSTLSI